MVAKSQTINDMMFSFVTTKFTQSESACKKRNARLHSGGKDRK